MRCDYRQLVGNGGYGAVSKPLDNKQIKETPMTEKPEISCEHETTHFDPQCAAYVCVLCEDHIGLDRCWCGWSRYGRNGANELLDMGEMIEPEDY